MWHRDVRARESAAAALLEESRILDRESSKLRKYADELRQEVITLEAQVEACDRQADSQRESLEGRKREIQTLQIDIEEKQQLISAQRAEIDDLGGR